MDSRADDSSFYGLFTKERADSVDLLGRLILNQREAIVVCGAEGIGKTRLLTFFKNNRENIWIICFFQGSDELSFEQVQDQLVLGIKQRKVELADDNLDDLLRFCEQQQQKLVLIIDDAAHLADGFITTLTEYALQNPVLRIVFSFTREQLYQKNFTDRVVDDCYFMELPSLTKTQTADFVKNTDFFSNQNIDRQAISDNLINKLYQRTAGVPGKILKEFPLLIEAERNKILSPLLKKSLVIGVIALCFIAIFFVYNKKIPPQTSPLKPVQLAAKQNASVIAKQNKKAAIAENVKSLTALKKTTEPPVSQPIIQQDADEQWILQQGAGKYTLQLMALSKRQALLNIVKKHHNLESELKILRVKNRNQEKYILLYGSFADSKDAYTAVKSLPNEFKQAWPRKIQELQQEIKNRNISLNQSPSK